MLELGAELESRDLAAERLTEAELEALIGQRDCKEFLNPRNEGLSNAKHEGTSAFARESHSLDGQGAQLDSQATRHSRFANGFRFR